MKKIWIIVLNFWATFLFRNLHSCRKKIRFFPKIKYKFYLILAGEPGFAGLLSNPPECPVKLSLSLNKVPSGRRWCRGWGQTDWNNRDPGSPRRARGREGAPRLVWSGSLRQFRTDVRTHKQTNKQTNIALYIVDYSPSLQAVLCGFPRNQEVLKTFLGLSD